MAKWKDKKRGLDKPEITESEINLGAFRVSIHHYIGYENTWFTTCSYLYSKSELIGQDLDSLKDQALEKFTHILKVALEEIPTE